MLSVFHASLRDGTALVALALLCSALVATQAQAEEARPFLHPLFQNHMVLPRDVVFPVWGWTTPGAVVTVSLEESRARTTADAAGAWEVKLGPFPAGGPHTVVVEGPVKATLTDVLLGDVWLCSGQSNMEMGIGEASNAAEEIKHADYPRLRLFAVPRNLAREPRGTCGGTWKTCSPETVADGGWGGFSAVAYYFGRDLLLDQKVPIGLIDASWGGTPAEAWTSAEALRQLPEFRPKVEELARSAAASHDDDPNQVTVLYNGLIAPLVPFAIKGVIWYQGESNVAQPAEYQALLPALIADWRARFGAGDFPFLVVQLANFLPLQQRPSEGGWAWLREAQLLISRRVPKTALVVTTDIGDAVDVHPKNKQEVGRRLALAAKAIAYGKKVEYSGPIYREMKVEGSRVRVTFDHAAGGLVARGGGELTGFAIAGADRQFVWAQAIVDGRSVIISSKEIVAPMAVRYNWANNPIGNLDNAAGLPASCFRTDDWPGPPQEE